MSEQRLCRTRRTIASGGTWNSLAIFSRSITPAENFVRYVLNRYRSPCVFRRVKKQKSTYISLLLVGAVRRWLSRLGPEHDGRTFFARTNWYVSDFGARRTTCYRIPFPEPTAPPAGVLPLFGSRKRAGTGPGGRRTAPQPRATTPTAGPRGFSVNAHNPPPLAKLTPAAYPARVAPPPASYRFSAVTVSAPGPWNRKTRSAAVTWTTKVIANPVIAV